MDPLERKFKELEGRGEGAQMTHVYYGDPSEEFSIKLIETLAQNGADIIELGIPFSDPIADGPVFQAACERALNAWVTPPKCIEAVKRLRKAGLKTPIIITTYFNIPYVMGFEKFLSMIKEAGAQGLLVPDMPIEEAEPYLNMAAKTGLHLILQVAPTTSDESLKKIVDAASGFIYLVSLEGVTGSKLTNPNTTFKLIKKVKAQTQTPVMVGFGISKREHAKTIVDAGADGVVVGSAYAKIYSKNLQNPFAMLPEIARLSREIKTGCIKQNWMKTRATSSFFGE
jgi:tryptophan synthase alpha chain